MKHLIEYLDRLQELRAEGQLTNAEVTAWLSQLRTEIRQEMERQGINGIMEQVEHPKCDMDIKDWVNLRHRLSVSIEASYFATEAADQAEYVRGNMERFGYVIGRCGVPALEVHEKIKLIQDLSRHRDALIETLAVLTTDDEGGAS
jgi:hypothetical protein